MKINLAYKYKNLFMMGDKMPDLTNNNICAFHDNNCCIKKDYFIFKDECKNEKFFNFLKEVANHDGMKLPIKIRDWEGYKKNLCSKSKENIIICRIFFSFIERNLATYKFWLNCIKTKHNKNDANKVVERKKRARSNDGRKDVFVFNSPTTKKHHIEHDEMEYKCVFCLQEIELSKSFYSCDNGDCRSKLHLACKQDNNSCNNCIIGEYIKN